MICLDFYTEVKIKTKIKELYHDFPLETPRAKDGVKMRTLILTNGNGNRMQPLSKYLNKSMIPVGGKPILEHIIEHLISYGFNEIIIAVGVLRHQIMKYFGNGQKWGAKITYVVNYTPQGTAGELASAEKFFREQDNFLIYYGDTLTKTNLVHFCEYHRHYEAIATLNGILGLPLETGVIKQDSGRVIEFQEKPIYSVLTNVPLFFCTKEIFVSDIEEGKDFFHDIIPPLAKEGKIRVYIQNDNYHYDVGNMERLERISQLYDSGKVGTPRVIK